MNSEKTRLQTFALWQHCDTQRPEALANCGLFYTGDQDRVECAFCHGVINKWLKTDIPWEEHSRHFPRCPFIRDFDVGNIPSFDSTLHRHTNDRVYNSAYGACIPSYHSPMIQGHSNNSKICYGNVTDTPGLGNYRYPEPVSSPYTELHAPDTPSSDQLCSLYVCQHTTSERGRTIQEKNIPSEQITNSSEQITLCEKNTSSEQITSSENDLKKRTGRLQTFKSWSQYLKPTAEELACAGFYHCPRAEKADRVKCVYCDGKVFNWKTDDDPLIVHARFFPYCPYIEECIGKNVLNNLQSQLLPGELQARNTQDKNLIPTSSANPDRHSSPASPPSQPEDILAPHMRSEQVQAVLQMGFSEELVRETVESCLRDGLIHLPPGEELASMVMELEEEHSPGEAGCGASSPAAHPMTPLQRMMAARAMNSPTSGIV